VTRMYSGGTAHAERTGGISCAASRWAMVSGLGSQMEYTTTLYNKLYCRNARHRARYRGKSRIV
jgi:hypothetical protein